MRVQAVKMFVCLISLVGSMSVFASPFQEGKHYLQIPQSNLEHEQVETLKEEFNEKVLVIEFFSYGCHWCYQLDPKVSEWKKALDGKKVEFKRYPVVFQNSWVNLSKAYFTAVALGVEDKMHAALFEEIQEERIQSSAPGVLQNLFVERGVDGLEFSKTFDSFSIEQQFKQANQVAIALRITAIPSFVVYGPKGAIVTSSRMAGSEEELFEVLDTVIKQESEALVSRKDS